MNAFDVCSGAMAGAVAAAAVAVAFRGARRGAAGGPAPVTCANLFAAAIAAGVLAIAACLAPGVGAFGAIRVVYLACVVSLPLAAAVLLAVAFRRLTRAAAVVAVLSLFAAPLGVYASFVEPYDLRLESAVVDVGAAAGRAARGGREDVRVGVLADLQCNRIGEHERRAVDTLLAQHPDVILVPGDLMHGTPEEYAEHGAALGDLLARLDAPGGVYFVMGDVDRDRTLEILRGTKVRALLDEVVRVRVRDRDLTVGGVSRHEGGVVRELERTAGEDDVRILLVHRPDAVLRLAPRSRIDLTVAGHTHGGQVVIPGFGPPMTLSRVPRRVAAGGLHDVAGNRIYVSRGAGMERRQAPALRLFCPPEVTVLTLSGGGPPRE